AKKSREAKRRRRPQRVEPPSAPPAALPAALPDVTTLASSAPRGRGSAGGPPDAVGLAFRKRRATRGDRPPRYPGRGHARPARPFPESPRAGPLRAPLRRRTARSPPRWTRSWSPYGPRPRQYPRSAGVLVRLDTGDGHTAGA